jgi:ferredoxin
MEYSNHELEIEAFRDFPYDRNNAVCPTGAITWPLEEYAPAVDPDTCISCGLCVSRCPTRAIYLDEHGAHVNDEPNYHFQVRDFPATTDNTEATARLFDGIAEDGIYRAETDDVFGRFFRHFREVAKNQSAQFPNHLARNLLIACGVGAAMRRRGDTNVRMEMVLGPPGVEGGTADVELGAGVLDAPRKVLDNIAILVARYRMAKDRVVPLVITLSMPNQRSEYWQVVRDIRDVLGVKINSLTIGALVLLLWNRTKIAVREGEELYVDVDSTSLRPGVEAFLGRKINVVRGYPGLLESEK